MEDDAAARTRRQRRLTPLDPYGPTFHTWNVGPYHLRVSLRIATLGLLAECPGSGYDLLKRFEKSMANVWPATQSQLYGELNKLADAGLVEVSAAGPRGRKEYRITPAGRGELVRWVTSSHDDQPVRRPGLLRVFLLGEIPPAEARAHMAAVAEHAEAEVTRLEQLRDGITWRDDDSGFYGRAALEYGLAEFATKARWARALIEDMDARNGDRQAQPPKWSPE